MSYIEIHSPCLCFSFVFSVAIISFSLLIPSTVYCFIVLIRGCCQFIHQILGSALTLESTKAEQMCFPSIPCESRNRAAWQVCHCEPKGRHPNTCVLTSGYSIQHHYAYMASQQARGAPLVLSNVVILY